MYFAYKYGKYTFSGQNTAKFVMISDEFDLFRKKTPQILSYIKRIHYFCTENR